MEGGFLADRRQVGTGRPALADFCLSGVQEKGGGLSSHDFQRIVLVVAEDGIEELLVGGR